MRTAICLSGQPRNKVERFITTIYEKLIKPNNCDVFVCSNTFSGGKKDPWLGLVTTMNDLGISPKVLELREDIFIDQETHPVFAHFRNGRVMSENKGKVACTRIQRCLQCLYYIEQCNRNKTQWEESNNFVYDWVIKCRIGLEFLEKLDLAKFDNNLVHLKEKPGASFYVDCFAYGSSKNMNIYSNRLSALLKEEEVPSWVLSTENQMKYLLEKNDVVVSSDNIPKFKNVEH